jgi:hypothetical protein
MQNINRGAAEWNGSIGPHFSNALITMGSSGAEGPRCKLRYGQGIGCGVICLRRSGDLAHRKSWKTVPRTTGLVQYEKGHLR